MFIDYLVQTINSDRYLFEVWIWKRKWRKNEPIRTTKNSLWPRQCTMSLVNEYDRKITRRTRQIASVITVFARFGSQLLTNAKHILAGMTFGWKKDMISESMASTTSKNKSLYKKSIEMLQKHWNYCIAFERKKFATLKLTSISIIKTVLKHDTSTFAKFSDIEWLLKISHELKVIFIQFWKCL